jgi:phosphomannomutase/phosphoglucomutase
MGRWFGTNGIREVVGKTLTARFVADMATACALAHDGVGGPAVVGTDGRTSSPAFGRIVSGALSCAGRDVIEVGVLPTPAIQYAIPPLRAAFGLIVTASHNPPEFNGLKGISADGLEFPPSVEDRAEALYVSGKVPAADYMNIGRIERDLRAGDRYVDGILSVVDAPRIRDRRFRVVLDCGNGASALTSPPLLSRLGVRYRTLNGNVDGLFPGRPSEPTEANLSDLCRSVPLMGADLGVAHDGDADRAVFVDEKGRFVPGEKVLTLLAREEIRRAGGGLVVTPVTSSDSVKEVIEPLGGRVLYTRVGSPVVARTLQEKKGVFGGEENGGCLFPAHQLARDGAMTLARMLEVLSTTSKTLSALIDELPQYHLVKRKVRGPVEVREQLLQTVLSHLDRLPGGPWEVVTLDGVKAIGPLGWTLIRPSGTEPLYRVFTESRDRRSAEELADATVALVEEALGQIPPAS